MKRRGRKSKSAAVAENGVNEKAEENGDASDRDVPEAEEPQTKKKKAAKKKNASKKSEESSDEAQYEVEKVIDEKNIKGVKHFLIRWKGYEPESDTWEPESTLNCADLISEFVNSKKKQRGRPKAGKKNSPEEDTWDENENFEVDRILEVYFKKNGEREFLVSWKGYPPSKNSWEPEENMNCKDLIQKFMAKVDKAKAVDQKELRVNRPLINRLSYDKGGRASKRNKGKQRVVYHDAE